MTSTTDEIRRAIRLLEEINDHGTLFSILNGEEVKQKREELKNLVLRNRKVFESLKEKDPKVIQRIF